MTSNTESKYYSIPRAVVSGNDKTVTASANASAYDSTSNLVSGTYTSSATTGYTYHIDSSASASVDTQTATKSISDGYTAGETVTAKVNGASTGSKTAKTYLKDSTSSVALTSNAATVALGTTLTIGKGYYPYDRTYTIPTASGSAGTTTASAALNLGTAPSGYTNPTLVANKASGSTYIELKGEVTGYTTGKVLSSVTTPQTKYMEVYTGTYSIL